MFKPPLHVVAPYVLVVASLAPQRQASSRGHPVIDDEPNRRYILAVATPKKIETKDPTKMTKMMADRFYIFVGFYIPASRRVTTLSTLSMAHIRGALTRSPD